MRVSRFSKLTFTLLASKRSVPMALERNVSMILWDVIGTYDFLLVVKLYG